MPPTAPPMLTPTTVVLDRGALELELLSCGEDVVAGLEVGVGSAPVGESEVLMPVRWT